MESLDDYIKGMDARIPFSHKGEFYEFPVAWLERNQSLFNAS